MVSPYLNHFIQPDMLIPTPVNPQDFNRYSYVNNRSIILNDPSGHCAVRPGKKCPINPKVTTSWANNGASATPTITSTYTSTSSPTLTLTRTATPTKTPVPTPIDLILEDAKSLIQLSETGKGLYEWGINNGFAFDYSDDCAGHLDNKKILLNPCRPSAVYSAGQIGHEILHHILYPGHTGSLVEEYQAFMVGDAIRAELISKGYGTGSNLDIGIPLSKYTVQLENNPNLANDLEMWFDINNLDIYIRPRNAANGIPTGWGVLPFPLTFTPRP